MITINVGLERSTDQSTIPMGAALVVIERHLGQPQRVAIVESDTEPTLVAEFPESDTLRFFDIELAAIELDQDCIAVLHDDQGFLVGPNAAKWAPFNPHYFINADGTRLGDRVPA